MQPAAVESLPAPALGVVATRGGVPYLEADVLRSVAPAATSCLVASSFDAAELPPVARVGDDPAPETAKRSPSAYAGLCHFVGLPEYALVLLHRPPHAGAERTAGSTDAGAAVERPRGRMVLGTEQVFEAAKWAAAAVVAVPLDPIGAEEPATRKRRVAAARCVSWEAEAAAKGVAAAAGFGAPGSGRHVAFAALPPLIPWAPATDSVSAAGGSSSCSPQPPAISDATASSKAGGSSAPPPPEELPERWRDAAFVHVAALGLGESRAARRRYLADVAAGARRGAAFIAAPPTIESLLDCLAVLDFGPGSVLGPSFPVSFAERGVAFTLTNAVLYGSGTGAAPVIDVASEERVRRAAELADLSEAERRPAVGLANMWDPRWRLDRGPLVGGDECNCAACRRHSRGYLHHLLGLHEINAQMLLTLHNIATVSRLLAAYRAEVAGPGGRGAAAALLKRVSAVLHLADDY